MSATDNDPMHNNNGPEDGVALLSRLNKGGRYMLPGCAYDFLRGLSAEQWKENASTSHCIRVNGDAHEMFIEDVKDYYVVKGRFTKSRHNKFVLCAIVLCHHHPCRIIVAQVERPLVFLPRNIDVLRCASSWSTFGFTLWWNADDNLCLKHNKDIEGIPPVVYDPRKSYKPSES